MTSDTNGAMEDSPIGLSQIGKQLHIISDKLPGYIAVNSKRDKLTDANVLRPSTLPNLQRHTRPTVFNWYPTLVAGQLFGLLDQRYVGCFNDTAGSIKILNALCTANYTTMAVEWCLNYRSLNGVWTTVV